MGAYNPSPEWFAAAVPVCGSGIPSLAGRLTDIAIWAMHGEADTTVPPQGTRDMENAVKAAYGNKIRTSFIPASDIIRGLRHTPKRNFWTGFSLRKR